MNKQGTFHANIESYQNLRYYPIMILRNFIVFEGIDGTGTTTQLDELKKRFAATAASVHFTCEPTPGAIGRLIRQSLRGEMHLTADTMARLFAADRGEHLYGENGIVSLTGSGTAVFSDRYLFSSLAYQAEAGSPELPAELNRHFPLPEYLFYFDIESDAAMTRVESRAGTLEIYEKREFQKKVRARYLDVIDAYEKAEPDMRVIRIDASLPIAAIAEKIWSIVGNLPKMST